ncbi:MAG: lipid II flippase MurJ [Sulfuricaulis sp.]
MGLQRRYIYLVGLSSAGYLLSFASQMVISYHFGTSSSLDAYWVALATVNALAFYQHPIREALVPEFHSRLDRDPHAANDYFSRAFTLVVLLSALAALAAWLMPGTLAGIVASGIASSTRQQVVVLLQGLAPAILLLAVSEILNGILTCYNRVIWQALARMLGAISSLASLLSLAGIWGAKALVVAFLAGQAAMAAVQIYMLYRLGLRYRPRWARRLGHKFFAVAGALLVSYLLSQGYAVFEKNTFAYFSAGLVSAFQYGTVIVNVLISVIALSMSQLLWPRFLDGIANDDHMDIRHTTARATRFLLLLLGLLCLFFFLEAERVIRLVYARGAFGQESVAQTVTAFRAAIFAAMPIAVTSILVRVLVSLRAANALSWIGGIMAVGGIATLAAARAVHSQELAMFHWLIGNSIGVAVTCWFYSRAYDFRREDVVRSLLWVVRLVTVMGCAWWLFRWLDLGSELPVLLGLGVSFGTLALTFGGLSLAFGLFGLPNRVRTWFGMVNPTDRNRS